MKTETHYSNKIVLVVIVFGICPFIKLAKQKRSKEKGWMIKYPNFDIICLFHKLPLISTC